MGKIGLLTLDAKSYNYGGILQEYALLTILKRFGDSEIINYDVRSEKNTFSMSRSIFNFSIDKVLGRIALCKNKKKLRGTSVRNDIEKRKRRFDDFRYEYLDMSEAIEFPFLGEKTGNYEAIVCGSDQIWNPDYNIPSFFFDFEYDGKKIVYGASIGKAILTARQRKVYGKYLNKLKYVSVREKSVVDLLHESTNIELNTVLDPTLLLDKNEWYKITKKCSIETKYIFCYFLDFTEEKIKAVRKYAYENGLCIVTIPYLHNQYEEFSARLAEYLISDVGPGEFLWLIENAEAIITDSFHASLFSMVFNKEFWVFGRKSGTYDMNTRLECLLSYFEAENRMIHPEELKHKVLKKVSYDTTLLNDVKDFSMLFLENALSE